MHKSRFPGPRYPTFPSRVQKIKRMSNLKRFSISTLWSIQLSRDLNNPCRSAIFIGKTVEGLRRRISIENWKPLLFRLMWYTVQDRWVLNTRVGGFKTWSSYWPKLVPLVAVKQTRPMNFQASLRGPKIGKHSNWDSLTASGAQRAASGVWSFPNETRRCLTSGKIT